MIVTKSSELLRFSKFNDDQNEIKLKKINKIEQLKNIKKGDSKIKSVLLN